jgi:hypothetical protein
MCFIPDHPQRGNLDVLGISAPSVGPRREIARGLILRFVVPLCRITRKSWSHDDALAEGKVLDIIAELPAISEPITCGSGMDWLTAPERTSVS